MAADILAREADFAAGACERRCVDGAGSRVQRLMRGQVEPISAQIVAESKVFKSRMQSVEAQEAFTAFFEKRPPDFRKARG